VGARGRGWGEGRSNDPTLHAHMNKTKILKKEGLSSYSKSCSTFQVPLLGHNHLLPRIRSGRSGSPFSYEVSPPENNDHFLFILSSSIRLSTKIFMDECSKNFSQGN
jgi:hypothetical protein